MKLSENGDMESHLNAMLNSVDQLVALGETLKEKMIIALLLCNLPELNNTLISVRDKVRKRVNYRTCQGQAFRRG